jgi:hypothetical protein
LNDGNILASLRSVSAVIIIEKSTGDIIWHLDASVVAQQHCANELPNGNILVSSGLPPSPNRQIFDNGAFRHRESYQFSRAIEVDRVSKKIVWEWTAPNNRVRTCSVGPATDNRNLSTPRSWDRPSDCPMATRCCANLRLDVCSK